jgi:hypothetical protein
MTRTVSASNLRPLPRFTFAGRGCRDPRREPRRLPQSLRIQPPGSVTAAPSQVATALPEAARPSAVPSSATESTRPAAGNGDRPPPAALRYGPGPWQIPMSLWWSSGAAMPS